jgi:lipoprotein-releasing system permease protein
MLERVAALQAEFGPRLREVTYVASLIGRPELAYWLVFALLVLMLVLGINSGFVAAGSGRIDLRAGFELFVARRHVEVFRPSLLLGTMAVLMLGIIPPLLIYGIVRSVEAAASSRPP